MPPKGKRIPKRILERHLEGESLRSLAAELGSRTRALVSRLRTAPLQKRLAALQRRDEKPAEGTPASPAADPSRPATGTGESPGSTPGDIIKRDLGGGRTSFEVTGSGPMRRRSSRPGASSFWPTATWR